FYVYSYYLLYRSLLSFPTRRSSDLAVAVAELLPVPTNVSMQFSLSFPLELSAAILFPTPAAAVIAFLGSADPREFRGEVPPLKRSEEHTSELQSRFYLVCLLLLVKK